MRKSRHQKTSGQGLDSLVDIVSNTVGILIILAVFMALVAQMDLPGSGSTEEPEVPTERPAQRILVPWAHATTKNAVFFYLNRNRVHALDLPAFYEELVGRSAALRNVPLRVDLPGLETRFFPVTNHVYCLEFRPEAGYGESAIEMNAPGSAWQKARSRHSPERFFYFFWVTGDSFEMFRELRNTLWDQDVEVGWKPVHEEAPLEICNGFDGSSAFQPQ